MEYYAGIDVSLEASSICVVDASGKIARETKVSSEPEALIAWFKSLPFTLARIGLEAGPLSQWLYAGLKEAGFAIELLETRHVRDAFQSSGRGGETPFSLTKKLSAARCGTKALDGFRADTPSRSGVPAGTMDWVRPHICRRRLD